MKHPNNIIQKRQERLLEQLPLELREKQAMLFRFGNARYIYHQQARSFEPSKQDFEEWLEGLPDPVRFAMQERGFDGCKGVLSFTRYVMEKNNIGMEMWLKENLSADDYNEYKKKNL